MDWNDVVICQKDSHVAEFLDIPDYLAAIHRERMYKNMSPLSESVICVRITLANATVFRGLLPLVW